MNTKTITKVIAAFLAFILSFANVLLLGSYVDEVYGASSNLEEQTKSVNKSKIEFDAYFKNEENNITHSKSINVDEEDKNLYLSIKVEDGYLTDANVKVQDANFKVLETKEQLDIIQNVSSDENKIALNQINKDESVILKLPIEINTGFSFDAKDLCKKATITLEGKYVNNKGKETKVKKDILVEASIDGTAESSLSEDIIKYVPFNIEGKRGVILQTSIKSKLVDNKLPVKMTKLEIEIPDLNNIEPENIEIVSKTTMATNGQKGKTYNKDEYEIKDGKIILELKNNDNMLSWIKNSEDEIIITYTYNEKAVADKIDLKLNAKSEITYYAKEMKTVKQEINKNQELTEKIGDLITGTITTSQDKLYKGYMLAEKGKNTELAEKLTLNIGYIELADKITFKDETSYVDQNGNTYPSNALYKSSKIVAENLIQILGEDGYINIYRGNGELVATLNKENTEISYEKEETNLKFETSKPVNLGILEIENERYIKPLEYSKEQEAMFTEIKVNLVSNLIKNEKVITNTNIEKKISLENTTSQAGITINQPNISTVVKAEYVELRVTLKTTDASTALYKNPTIEIVLPSYITNIDLNNVKLMYEKELKILNTQKTKNQNGNIVIKIELEGEQKSYNEEWVTEGATLIVNTDMTINVLTPTREEKIYLNVKNQNTNENVTAYTDVIFVAPAGIATISQINGYGNPGEVVTTISGNLGVGEIAAKAPRKEATMQIVAINNYTYNCKNVVLLGRTPFKGNKAITSDKDLGSTFTAKLISEVKSKTGLNAEQIKVYYSANEEATKDLNDINNAWVTDRNLINEVKSYMIVLNDYIFKTGDILGFEYNIEIPANLDRHENTFGTFVVYYEKEQANENVAKVRSSEGMGLAEVSRAEVVEGTPIGLSTGTGPNLSVELKSSLEAGKTINTMKQIHFEVNVKNNGILKAENVKVKVNLPNNMYYATFNSSIGAYIADTAIREVNLTIPEIRPRRNRESGIYIKNITLYR